MSERIDLYRERILSIPEEQTVPEPFRDFFHDTAKFLIRCLSRENGEGNEALYRDILPENYGDSWGNPETASEKLGNEYGPLLCAVYAELYGIIPCIFEKKEEGTAILLELFLEYYSSFEGEEIPDLHEVKSIFTSYLNDYLEDFVADRLEETLNPGRSFVRDLVMGADLSGTAYLERFGEYVTDQTRKTSAFVNSLPQEVVDRMAECMTDGYLNGFTDKSLIEKKKSCSLRFELGFERLARAVVLKMEEHGYQTTIARSAFRLTDRGSVGRIGFFGAIPNRQFDDDHKEDLALVLNADFVSKKLRALQHAYEKRKDLAGIYGGPMCLETFGEMPFVPQSHSGCLVFSGKQQEYYVNMSSEAVRITNRYIKGEERTFTIISFPVPAIGPRFPEIFEETVKINTLDSKKYQRIQQKIIDALDRGESVRILGKGKNRTDLTVALHPTAHPEKESKFENCVADVNIPVGEVFTSPKLHGTNGILHVSHVFLNDYDFRDLALNLTDGKISDYTCANYPTEAENKKYIEEHILFHHPTLPIGEFAIGTNTAAYAMMRKYGIEERMPILITEKTGPHFAMGDTCYSFQEDTPVWNPDGKEIIARDNEVTLLRKTDPSKAYFGCHTDITIPYEELGSIRAVTADGRKIPVIEDGRFVLPGTEELNEPLQEEE